MGEIGAILPRRTAAELLMYPSESVSLASHLHSMQLGKAKGNGSVSQIARLEGRALGTAVRRSSASFAPLWYQEGEKIQSGCAEFGRMVPEGRESL